MLIGRFRSSVRVWQLHNGSSQVGYSIVQSLDEFVGEQGTQTSTGSKPP